MIQIGKRKMTTSYSSPHKAAKQSGTPLSTGGKSVHMDKRLGASVAGNINNSLAICPPGMVMGEEDGSNLLPNSDVLRLMPLISAAAAQPLNKSAHELTDHPSKSSRKVTGTSDGEDLFNHMTSVENEGQVASHPDDKGEE